MKTETRKRIEQIMEKLNAADNMVHVTIAALTDGGGDLNPDAYADVLHEAVTKLGDGIIELRAILAEDDAE